MLKWKWKVEDVSSSTIHQRAWRTLKKCVQSQSQRLHPRTPLPHFPSLLFFRSYGGLISVISTTGERRVMSLIENILPFRRTSVTSARTRLTPSNGKRCGKMVRTSKAVTGEPVVLTGRTGTRPSVSSHLGIEYSTYSHVSHPRRSRCRDHQLLSTQSQFPTSLVGIVV